jgi:hypothetical protein
VNECCESATLPCSPFQSALLRPTVWAENPPESPFDTF